MILTGFLLTLGRILAELAIVAAIMAGFFILALAFIFPSWWKQKNCNHKNFRENSRCDAICNDCNKNLGFIGTWREKIKNV